MFRVCTWCGIFMGLARPIEDETTTHGICARCAERVQRESGRPRDHALIVVRRSRPEAYARLAEAFANLRCVFVVVDRRAGERRRAETPVPADRRPLERRRLLVNFHPHLHAIVSDGAFAANGWFYALPKVNPNHLEAAFRHRVLTMLRREGKIDDALIRKLLAWRHSGFSVHNQVRIESQDQAGREKLAQYVLRSPFSQQKLRYLAKSQTVIYRSKMHPVLKRNFEVFPVLDWLAALTAHIPNHGEHLVRYYGWYSNASRGKRKKAQTQGQDPAPEGIVEIPAPPRSRALSRRWAQWIKQIYEANPLVCPRCGGAMRIIAFIEQPEVIEKILTHLGLWPANAHSPRESIAA